MDFSEQVADILRADNTLEDPQREDLYDLAHEASNHWHLAAHLDPLPISSETKQQLLRAKLDSSPLAVRAIAQMQSIPREKLDYIEAHPNVLRAWIAAKARGGK